MQGDLSRCRTTGMTVGLVDTFDCLNATDAFWDVLPVIRCRPGRDDVCERLSFRLLVGTTSPCQGVRAIRIYIFNEIDFHELYTLDINEDDFQTLKADQGILVDFSKFADKVVDLVQKCIDAKGQKLPKFKAVLETCDGHFVFKLVETNDFKQIPHISLAFRQGDSQTVQCFLAFRTAELKSERDRLSASLAQREAELAATKEAVSDCNQKLQGFDIRNAQCSTEFECRLKDLQASAHRELVKQREDLLFASNRYACNVHQQLTRVLLDFIRICCR